VVLALLPGTGTGDEQHQPVALKGEAMGTTYSVQLMSWQHKHMDELGGRVKAVLEEVEGLMSNYRESSDVSRFNRAEVGEWVEVSAQTLAVVASALDYAQMSEGVFDPTVGALVNEWGFGPDSEKGVFRINFSSEEINAMLAQVGYEAVEMQDDPPALRKTAPRSLDLSALAKGYAVDRVVALLDEMGIQHYLVELGGDLRLKGLSPHGLPWRVGIEVPVAGQTRRAYQALRLSDAAVATSGDYRNHFVYQDRRYSHIMDSSSGAPVDNDLASVTVISDTAERADALATLLYALGPNRGLGFAEDEGIAAFFIGRDGDTLRHIHTAAFREYTEAYVDGATSEEEEAEASP